MQPAVEPAIPELGSPAAESPPRFDGWRVVGAAFVSQGVAMGLTFSAFSLFIQPIEADLGATRVQSNAGMSILMCVAALISPLLGRAIDRGPARAIMLGGVLLTALGLAVLSQVSSLLQFGLVLGLMVGVGHAMFGPLPAMTIVANWFIVRRGTAIGLASIGTTAAGFVMPLVAALLIDRFTWRGALLAHAAGGAALALPVIWLWMIRRPEDVDQHPDGLARVAHSAAETPSAASGSFRGLLRSRSFWLLAAIFGLMGTAPIALMSNLVPFASELGISRPRAASVLSGLALSACFGKIFFGLTVDRIDKRAALALALAIQASGWLIFLSEPGFGYFLLAGCLVGLGMGALLPVQGAMIGAAFGRSAFGQAMGLMGPFALVFTVTTPPLVGYLWERTGSYALPMTLLLGAFVLPALLLPFLRLPPSGRKEA